MRDEGIAWAELALRGDQAAGERALRLLLQAESTDPKQAADADLHVNLGFLEQASGDKARAASEYERALRADPWNESAGADLAVLDARQGNFAAALPLLAKVFRDDPGASAAGVDLAVAQCRSGRFRLRPQRHCGGCCCFLPTMNGRGASLWRWIGGRASCGAAANEQGER